MDALSIVLIIIVAVILFTYFYNIYIGYKVYKRRHNTFPPGKLPDCPDYWVYDKVNNVCNNPKKLGWVTSCPEGQLNCKKTGVIPEMIKPVPSVKDRDKRRMIAQAYNTPWVIGGKGSSCSKGSNCYVE